MQSYAGWYLALLPNWLTKTDRFKDSCLFYFLLAERIKRYWNDICYFCVFCKSHQGVAMPGMLWKLSDVDCRFCTCAELHAEALDVGPYARGLFPTIGVDLSLQFCQSRLGAVAWEDWRICWGCIGGSTPRGLVSQWNLPLSFRRCFVVHPRGRWLLKLGWSFWCCMFIGISAFDCY